MSNNPTVKIFQRMISEAGLTNKLGPVLALYADGIRHGQREVEISLLFLEEFVNHIYYVLQEPNLAKSFKATLRTSAILGNASQVLFREGELPALLELVHVFRVKADMEIALSREEKEISSDAANLMIAMLDSKQ